MTADAKKAAGKPQPKIVPGGYIVQLEAEGSLTKRAADLHNEFHLLARQDAGLDYSVRETFSEESVFVGLSLNLHDGDVQALKDLKMLPLSGPLKPSRLHQLLFLTGLEEKLRLLPEQIALCLMSLANWTSIAHMP